MLAAAPGLRSLCVNVAWKYIHISPTIQYFRLRCSPLTHLVWSPTFSMLSDCAPLGHLIRNLHVYESLESLQLRHLTKMHIDTFIASVTSNRYSDSFVLRNLSTVTVRLSLFLINGPAQEEMPGLLESIIRLLATLWPSGTHAQRRKTLRLEFRYKRGTLIPVTTAGSGKTSLNPIEDVLERLLWALQDVSAELEHVFATVNGAGSTVEFLFYDFGHQEDVFEIAEMRRAFIASLCSRLAGIFPELHQRGGLSVKFRSWSLKRGLWLDWVEDSKGNFEGIPYRRSAFD
ncbi:hypothetical protein C8T65DRAFT_280320 [Cerioporus squamosus]|nr:hypothetical protein C8T65DRAFT_280320 [Cerioporus squamosus]